MICNKCKKELDLDDIVNIHNYDQLKTTLKQEQIVLQCPKCKSVIIAERIQPYIEPSLEVYTIIATKRRQTNE